MTFCGLSPITAMTAVHLIFTYLFERKKSSGGKKKKKSKLLFTLFKLLQMSYIPPALQSSLKFLILSL